MVKGLTSALPVTACIPTPETASAAPARTAMAILGRRIRTTILYAADSAPPESRRPQTQAESARSTWAKLVSATPRVVK